MGDVNRRHQVGGVRTGQDSIKTSFFVRSSEWGTVHRQMPSHRGGRATQLTSAYHQK